MKMKIQENDIINIIDIKGNKVPVTVTEITDSHLSVMQKSNSFKYGLFTQYLTNLKTSQCIKTRGIEKLN